MTHAPVDKRQRIRAKVLRRTMTRAETLLWRYLKAHYVDGPGFRRQLPMHAYFVDFVCHSARLVVELDGESHDFESRQRSDRTRDAWFDSQGYAVLRFTDRDAMTNLSGVIEAIRAAASARGVTPLPNPPPQGGREHAETVARHRKMRRPAPI